MTTDSDLENGMSPLFYSNWPFIINLSNSIIGIAVLALPFCFKECGLILGVILLLGSAWITSVTCHLLMKASVITKRRSYGYLALHMFGMTGKFAIEISIIGLLIGTCIAFYIIIGDIAPVIVSNLFGLENTDSLRTVLLIAVTLFGVIPLGMMQSLESLSRFSAISLSFYSFFALHVIASAFTNFFSGVWIKKLSYWNPDGLFKCLPIFALSYSCQTQLFIINESLPEPSLKRMNVITRNAITFVSCLYIVVGCFGYIAFFDDEITGDVLMNFRPTLFSELIKLGFVVSTIISFPLVIFPCRASIYTLLFAAPHIVNKTLDTSVVLPTSYFRGITLAIVGFTLCVGIAVPSVEFMLAITGATMGSLVCYIFPAVTSMTIASLGHGKQKIRAQFVLFVGIAILLASTYTTLTTQEKMIQQDSVVKVAQPIQHKDEEDVIVVDEIKHDSRHEPPNPREPLEQPGPPDKLSTVESVHVQDVEVSKKDPQIGVEGKPHAVNELDLTTTKTQLSSSDPHLVNTTKTPAQSLLDIADLKVEGVGLPIKSDEGQPVKQAVEVKQAWVDNDSELAKNLLVELRKQHEEQKQLLQEQRQIVDELKLHQIEIHRIDDKHWHQDAQHNMSMEDPAMKIPPKKAVPVNVEPKAPATS